MGRHKRCTASSLGWSIMNKPYDIEKTSRREINSEVNRKIEYTIQLAYNHSPFYRKKFDSLGLKPERIVDGDSLLTAIRKGLRLTKGELLSEFSRVVTDYVSDISVAEIWSSGSTGAPKRVWYAPDDLRRSYGQVRLAYNAMGLCPGDYVVNMFSPPPNASGPLSYAAGLDMGLHMLQLAIPLKTDRLLQVIKMTKPKSLFAISTRMNQLPTEIEQIGEKASNLGLDCVLTGGEPYSKEKRAIIQGEWGNVYVADVWASAEASVLGYTSEDCHIFGMHIPENRLLVEAVDPDTLEPVGKGQIGVDLVTTLYDVGERPATILIGYSHNDSIKVLDVNKCDCGRSFKMIEWPLLRREDILCVSGQNLDVRLGTESAICKYPFLTKEYLIIHRPIDGRRLKPYLEIRIEANKRDADLSESAKQDVRREIWSKVISNPAAEDIVFSQSETQVQFFDRGNLFQGYEEYFKPSKPVRIITL